MDVACHRCHAEYEFDDALISERGTTVFCTSCGLQFKIFPAERRGDPEEWTLTPALPGTRPRTFGSLRDLQRAILSGEVKEADLLARGGQQARSLGSIAELEPLLRRPRSAPPPARTEEVPLGLGPSAHMVQQRRTAGGTVMGLAAPRVPRFPAEAPPAGSVPPAERPSASEVQRDSIDDNAVVPPTPDPPGADRAKDEPWQSPPGQTLRPRIQSVLSRSPVPAPAAEPQSAVAAPPSSSRLRATLAHSTPHSTPPSTPGRGRTGPAAPDSSSDPPASRTSRFDSEPFSVIPGTRPRPLARGAWIVVSVLVGATAFVLTAARERVFALFDSGAREQSPHLVSAERAAVAAAELCDEAWLRARMAREDERAANEAVLEARLVALAQTLDESAKSPLGRTTAWTLARVHYLRMKGDVPAARAALSQAKGAPIVDPYLLAMLDLADQSGQRPFASILRRLKDASSGERGRYRMRSAYIVALVEAGQLAAAKDDFARLAQNGDAQNAPLYGDLEQFLRRQGPEESASPTRGNGETGKAPLAPPATSASVSTAPAATEPAPTFGSSPPALPTPGKAPPAPAAKEQAPPSALPSGEVPPQPEPLPGSSTPGSSTPGSSRQGAP